MASGASSCGAFWAACLAGNVNFVHKAFKVLLLLLLALPALLLVAGQLGALRGRAPDDLGIHNGRLKPPSMTPNSVSSQADLYPDHPQRAYASVLPLPLKSGDGPASLVALVHALQSMPGVTVVDQQADYLRAQAETRWLKFTDDLEFWINPVTQVIELRSASRVGRKDLGVNRKRLERLRKLYEQS